MTEPDATDDAGTLGGAGATDDTTGTASATTGFDAVVPKPVDVTPADEEFRLGPDAAIVAGETAEPVAEHLAALLRPATGYDLPVVDDPATGEPDDAIHLRCDGSEPDLGEEGYRLRATDDGVTVSAAAPAGLFWGVQTLRQVLPPAVERDAETDARWVIPGGEVLDYPRFDYRGGHLDVARRFLTADQVKRYVDHLALYKCNHLHLHLTDDQGWRLEIDGWPKLTGIGASTEVGGGPGGYYTREQYADLVAYARERFVTVVPEIDVPGHTNAALSAYGELNCDGDPAEPFTDLEVGFSTLCVHEESTYAFLDDVFREVAALTPGPFVHLGGDEVEELTDEEYATFVERATEIVERHGKRPVGWHEVLGAEVADSTVVQYWSGGRSVDGLDAAGAAAAGHEFVVSPASHAYLDMQYEPDGEMGNDWAGHVSLADAYEWDPGAFVEGVDESAVLGVEAALWTGMIETFDGVECMLFPRLPAVAERGWSPAATADFDDFRRRLAAHGPRWDRLGIDYYRSPDVAWPGA